MHRRIKILLSCMAALLLVGCAGDGKRTIAPKKATSKSYTIKGRPIILRNIMNTMKRELHLTMV